MMRPQVAPTPTMQAAGTEPRPGSPERLRRLGRRWASVVLTAVLAIGTVWAAAPAYAAGVSVSSPLGGATADADYATTLQVSGSGFQSIRGGFGGVYVMFGWVDGNWRPSQGGTVGADYRYIPDSESKDNQGFMRFVAFPGSETESAAHAVMGDDGSWAVELTVPGATFDTRDRDGNVISVNCLEVQCGVITIGAHGVKNANNETFTPVAFTTPAAAGTSGGGTSSTSGGGTSSTTTTTTGGDAAAAAVPSGQYRIGFDAAGAVAGNAFAFTAQGFTPGEQVVAVLDRGTVAVGPLTAGASGEVAAVMTLPADLSAGTHLLTVTGAGSGGKAEAELTVTPQAASLVTPAPTADVPAWLYAVMFLAIGLSAALLLANIGVRIVRAVRRRRAARRAAREEQAAQELGMTEGGAGGAAAGASAGAGAVGASAAGAGGAGTTTLLAAPPQDGGSADGATADAGPRAMAPSPDIPTTAVRTADAPTTLLAASDAPTVQVPAAEPPADTRGRAARRTGVSA